MDELQQMEHCAACQKLLPKSVAMPGCPRMRAAERHGLNAWSGCQGACDGNDDVAVYIRDDYDDGRTRVPGRPVVLPT